MSGSGSKKRGRTQVVSKPRRYEQERPGRVLTLPDAGPEHITIVHVQHNPLAVQRVFIHGSADHPSAPAHPARGSNAHITTGVIAGDVARLGDMVVRARVGAEARYAVLCGLRGRRGKRVLLIARSRTKHAMHPSGHHTAQEAEAQNTGQNAIHMSARCEPPAARHTDHSPAAIQRTCLRNDLFPKPFKCERGSLRGSKVIARRSRVFVLL